MPKTNNCKEKKLTASVMEQMQTTGVYVSIFNCDLTIGNNNTLTTFYSSRWHNEEQSTKSISEQVAEYLEQSPDDHLKEINQF